MNYILVGGGALGLACATDLLQRGQAVTILERGLTGRESSWAGGGILSPLCPWDYPEEVTRLALRGAEKFGAWAAALHEATGIDPEYTRSGMQVLQPLDMQKAKQWCVTHNMRMEEQDGGLLLPDVAQVRNPRLMQALRARVAQLGGNIIEQCEVTGLIARDDTVQKLMTTRGEYSADCFIITAGAWSKQVLGNYALALDIKPIRGQMLLYKFAAPPLPHILLQQDLYLIPRRDGHLLVGSTLEDVGFDKRTTTEARDRLIQRAAVLLPVLRDMPIIQHWAGLRPGSPHNIPTISRHPALQNLYINSGHFRYGVTMAPASVEILLNEINGETQPFDVSPYRATWS